MIETCAACKHWNQPTKDGKVAPFGMCRRRAPVPIMTGYFIDTRSGQPVVGMDGQPIPKVQGFFPETRPDVVCGEWEMRSIGNGAALVDVDLSKLAIGGEA